MGSEYNVNFIQEEEKPQKSRTCINTVSGRNVNIINNTKYMNSIEDVFYNNKKDYVIKHDRNIDGVIEGEDGTEEHILDEEIEHVEEEVVEEYVEYLQDDDENETVVPENGEHIIPVEAESENENENEIENGNDDSSSTKTVENTITKANEENYNGYDGPTSSVRAKRRTEEESVDEEQCRICLVKDNLINLFETIEQQNTKATIADLLMSICPAVSIAVKDFLPQFVCTSCLDKIIIAIQLKQQCETTEKELRKKLSRHKNKVRRPVGFVTIDGPLDSDPPSEEEIDEEFKVSDNSGSVDEDSDDTVSTADLESSRDSAFHNKKIRGNVSRRGRPRKYGRLPQQKRSKSKLDERHDLSDDPEYIVKRKRTSMSDDSTDKHQCKECGQSFNRKLSLVMHQKMHAYARDEPIKCHICGRVFKMKGAYRTHMNKHEERPLNNYKCHKCETILSNNAELKRHLVNEHNQTDVVYECSKCKRMFVNYSRFIRHQEERCPGYEGKYKRHELEAYAVGKDLFKAVAPLTTTYWSDSFSD